MTTSDNAQVPDSNRGIGENVNRRRWKSGALADHARRAGAAAAPLIRQASEQTPNVVKRAATTSIEKSRDLARQGVSLLTFKRFRESLESSMTDVVTVLAAQSAEIRRLEHRLDQIERTH